MSTNVPLPALGESVTEGTVSRWLKQVGDSVEADEALVEVSTDKVDTEIPSPVAGVVLEILVAEDETAEVGATLAVIGDAAEAPSGSGAPAGGEPAQQAEPQQAEPQQAEPEQQQAQPEPEQSEQAEPQQAQPQAQAPAASGQAGTEVTLPALGESVTEGTISRWLKQVGDSVEADEAIVEVSTDKVDTEIPSPVAGTVLEIRVAEDSVAPVGAVLAVIGDAAAAPSGGGSGADVPAAAEGRTPERPVSDTQDKSQAAAPRRQTTAAEEAIPEPEEEQPQSPRPPQPQRQAAAAEDVGYVTPLVRRLAAEHGISLSSLTGTGVGGRIRKQDVLDAAAKAKEPAPEPVTEPAPAATASAAAASTPAPTPAPSPAKLPAGDPNAESKRGTTEKMTRLRATIAKRMVESLQVAAQLTATVEVDLTAISRLRAKHKEEFKRREGASLSYLPFICRVVVEALKKFPKVNATIDTEAGTITYNASEDLGIAVDTEKGLLVPVIKGAGDLNIAGLARKIGDLAARTRASKVTPDELAGGSFTITNYGSAGTLMDTPIINQPQVAILGTGALVQRPVVLKDPELGQVIAVRDMMYLSMSYDHRLVDGADAARFLSYVKARLEEGDFAAELGG